MVEYLINFLVLLCPCDNIFECRNIFQTLITHGRKLIIKNCFLENVATDLMTVYHIHA